MEVEPTQDLSQVKMIALFVQWIGILMLLDPLPFLFAFRPLRVLPGIPLNMSFLASVVRGPRLINIFLLPQALNPINSHVIVEMCAVQSCGLAIPVPEGV